MICRTKGCYHIKIRYCKLICSRMEQCPRHPIQYRIAFSSYKPFIHSITARLKAFNASRRVYAASIEKKPLDRVEKQKDKSFWGVGGFFQKSPYRRCRRQSLLPGVGGAPQKPCLKSFNASRRVYAASIEKKPLDKLQAKK